MLVLPAWTEDVRWQTERNLMGVSFQLQQSAGTAGTMMGARIAHLMERNIAKKRHRTIIKRSSPDRDFPVRAAFAIYLQLLAIVICLGYTVIGRGYWRGVFGMTKENMTLQMEPERTATCFDVRPVYLKSSPDRGSPVQIAFAFLTLKTGRRIVKE